MTSTKNQLQVGVTTGIRIDRYPSVRWKDIFILICAKFHNSRAVDQSIILPSQETHYVQNGCWKQMPFVQEVNT